VGTAPSTLPSDKPNALPPQGDPVAAWSSDRPGTRVKIGPVGGPVRVAWREGTLTRAAELEALCAWARPDHQDGHDKVLVDAIEHHVEAAREAARRVELRPRRRFGMFRNGSLIERAISNLDAAEAHLLNLVDADYVLGQMPGLLRHVQCHLPPTDPRRHEFEGIARRLGIAGLNHSLVSDPAEHSPDGTPKKVDIIEHERRRIVSIVRAASSAALREQVRLRGFRNVVVVTTILMTLLALSVAVAGYFVPTLVPLCFAPEDSGEAVVVCPTAQSGPFVPEQAAAEQQPRADVKVQDIDDVVADTASPADLIVVELVGLAAAAVATAATIRSIRGSSERYHLPVALAVLKLPTGAITAFLGLLLMRGQFVPGLTALDTSAQILAWALVFGYAQQLFTRLVDQQGQTVVEDVRGADRPQLIPNPP
jgi:hypothetical protein